MYKFKHYDKEGNFLSEAIYKNQDYHYANFKHYIFRNDIIETIKLQEHILGTFSEKFVKKERV